MTKKKSNHKKRFTGKWAEKRQCSTTKATHFQPPSANAKPLKLIKLQAQSSTKFDTLESQHQHHHFPLPRHPRNQNNGNSTPRQSECKCMRTYSRLSLFPAQLFLSLKSTLFSLIFFFFDSFTRAIVRGESFPDCGVKKIKSSVEWGRKSRQNIMTSRHFYCPKCEIYYIDYKKLMKKKLQVFAFAYSVLCGLSRSLLPRACLSRDSQFQWIFVYKH